MLQGELWLCLIKRLPRCGRIRMEPACTACRVWFINFGADAHRLRSCKYCMYCTPHPSWAKLQRRCDQSYGHCDVPGEVVDDSITELVDSVPCATATTTENKPSTLESLCSKATP